MDICFVALENIDQKGLLSLGVIAPPGEKQAVPDPLICIGYFHDAEPVRGEVTVIEIVVARRQSNRSSLGGKGESKFPCKIGYSEVQCLRPYRRQPETHDQERGGDNHTSKCLHRSTSIHQVAARGWEV